jgi:uncharacterized protein (TIGR03437 family)
VICERATKTMSLGWRRCTCTLSACAFLLTCGSIRAFAQNQPIARTARPLLLDQDRYRLRPGDRVSIVASGETLNFLRDAQTRNVTVNATQGKGFIVAPNVDGDQVLLAASLTMKPGEYAVTVSAVSPAGEERKATVNVTIDALPVVPLGDLTPPVVLLNGWQFSVFPPSTCLIAPTGSIATFGHLASQLVAPQVYFFDNCVEQSVNGSSIEELGVTLGEFLNMVQYAGGTLVPEVDMVSHSMGGLIVRSYLAGLQPTGALSPVLNPRLRKFIEIATPNFGSFLAANYTDLLANGTQAAEMVPGSGFLWTLGTWNQGGDDLRGVDALAIIGNAGYWKASLFATTTLNDASDGVVSLTSASLNFARDPSRTRILPYCHIDSATVAGAFIDCTGRGIANVDDAPETGAIVLSFLANTTAWEFTGYTNQTQYGGTYFALENAAGTQFTPLSRAQLGLQAFESGWTNTIFYNEFVPPETAIVAATSTANQASTCGPFTVSGGTFSIFRCKYNPVIFSVGPLLPNVAGRVVTSGGNITISGVGFGQLCSGCQVLAYPGPVTLHVSSWSDSAIAALLPSTFDGIAEVVVQAASGSDAVTFMASPPPLPPIISLSSTQLQFKYMTGGASPAAQSVVLTNSGGGTLNWSAASGASWLTVSPSSGIGSGTLTLGINTAGLTAQTYTGAISITAAGTTNSPQTISVTLTVTTPAPSTSPVVTLVANAFGDSPVIAPNTWVAITGSNLAPAGDARMWQADDFVNSQLPTALDGVSVTMNGQKAYVYYISGTQINALTPSNLATGPFQVQVMNGTVSSPTFTAQAQQVSPSLFAFDSQGHVVAQHVPGYTDVGPTTLYPGVTTPALPGQEIVVYGNGFGSTTVPVVAGSETQSGTLPGTVHVTVGGETAQLIYAGLAGPGVYQFNIVLPTLLMNGDLPIQVLYNGQSTQGGAVITIQQ